MGMETPPLTDEQLIAQVRAGDKSSLQAFHDRYRNLVFTVAHRVCGQECDAETVLVTVFWEIWRNPSAWNPQRGSARTYLLLLTRSRARDLMRSERGRATAQRTAGEELSLQKNRSETELDPSEQLFDKNRSMRLREATQTLPDDVREALDLAFFAGLTHVDISIRLGIPLGTVKTRIRRGLVQLRERLTATKDDWLIQ
ncbi:sigma-70 family RNA polymerase sigma factor [Rubripirellula reticaptiva]|uniref:ECF RNA polymerase sigma factor SigK n=1 Tax=Rubripirellula reticaptiva TaxID=2528013 RepID=A0A5C6EDT5_9BACT|nr:sigma-70 family RNA polymerase sigma factor [Rubripirellula reticaptiva]TWU46645.1 ECF RNA polymerase sigma factor SigK [Rubripirellula reticaptiva]